MASLDIEMLDQATCVGEADIDDIDKTPMVKKQKAKPKCSVCHQAEAVKKPKRALTKIPRETLNFDKCRQIREFTRNFEKLIDLYKKLHMNQVFQEFNRCNSKWFTAKEHNKLVDQVLVLLEKGAEKYRNIKTKTLRKKSPEEKFHYVPLYVDDFEFIEKVKTMDWDNLNDDDDEYHQPKVVKAVGETEEEEEEEVDDDDEEEDSKSLLVVTPPPPSIENSPPRVAKKRKTKA